MAGKKWDYYKVARGTALTPSRASRGAFRGLVHGTKGVAKQAEFFKVERKGSFFGTFFAFAGKCLAAVVALGVVVAPRSPTHFGHRKWYRYWSRRGHRGDLVSIVLPCHRCKRRGRHCRDSRFNQDR